MMRMWLHRTLQMSLRHSQGNGRGPGLAQDVLTSMLGVKGNWKSKAWSSIKEMLHFAVFRMCIPEEFLKNSAHS